MCDSRTSARCTPKRTTCGATNTKQSKVGTFPFIKTPVYNYETVIMYVDIRVEGCYSPVTRRAWLEYPTAVGDPMRVRLETVKQNLGCAGYAPRVQLQTNVVGIGEYIPDDTPVNLSVETLSGSFLFGVDVRSDGVLIASAPPSTVTSPNANAFCPSTFYTSNNDVVDLGCKATVVSNSAAQLELRAVSVPRSERTYIEGGAPAYTSRSSAYSTYEDRCARRCGDIAASCCKTSTRCLLSEYDISDEFYLAWVEPGSTVGYPVTLTFVLATTCLPCERLLESEQTRSGSFAVKNLVTAGPRWTYETLRA